MADYCEADVPSQTGKTAFVTGANTGIGYDTARVLAQRGAKVLIGCRTEERAVAAISKIKEETPDADLKWIELDLADLSSIKAAAENVNKEPALDILINNAGYALPNAFHKNSMEDEEKCLRVLGTSVIALTKKYINDMISNGGRKIMIVSSVAAFAPASSLQSLYGPVKTFMNRFSESLSFYNKYGITSTAVCPGYTVTNFHTASGVQAEMDSVPRFLKKSAKRIAEEGVDAMLKGKKISVPTKTWKVIVFLLKIIPHSIFRLLSGLLAPGRYDEI